MGLKFVYAESELAVTGYSDTNWAGFKETRQLTTGFIVTVNGSPVNFKTIRNSIVALPHADAEYVTLFTTDEEVIWIRRLCWEGPFLRPFGKQSIIPTINVSTDSTAAIDIFGQEGLKAQSRHIEVRFHHVKTIRYDSVIELKHILIKDQSAYHIAKPVTRQVITSLRRRIIVETGLQFDD